MKILISLLSFIPNVALAVSSGIGEIAENLMEPIIILSNFMSSACLILGVCCFFAAFLRYSQYRVNHLAAPISTVIVLLILGTVLVSLPFVYLLTESGIPFTVR